MIRDRLFIAKFSSQKNYGKTFIANSGATSHMVTTQENMTNLRNAGTQVNVGDSGTLTGKKHRD